MGEHFESGPNALSFLRLLLAFEVVVWHAYHLRGATWLPDQVERILADVAVDSFFAISGFLICRSWFARPRIASFVLARSARILPGLWVCLVATAFVIAPAAAWWSGTATPTAAGQWAYVLGNADTWITYWGIGDGPVGVPRPGSWNGSLWSLGYEVGACVVLLGLGALGLLRAPVLIGLAASCWLVGASLVVEGLGNAAHPVALVPAWG
jgi:peptidoglycan/LPS O-acetylase OafA/YrhL